MDNGTELKLQRPLEGKLVRLRAREPEDEPFLWQTINDPEVTRFLMARYPFSHAQEKEWLEAQTKPDYGNLGLSVVTLADDRLIGSVGLHDANAEDRSATLGIVIGDKSCWDGGYGTDAMRLLCRYGFDYMNLHRIELDVYDGNDRARHVYEKVGFKHEATKRDALWKRGRFHDIHVMGLLEGELIAD